MKDNVLVSENTYYTKGYKYRLSESLAVMTGIYPEKEIVSDAGMIILTRESLLFIRPGYSSDGPSGPTIDTDDFMLGSFAHDALYELQRQEKFKNVICRDESGRELSAWDIRYVSDNIMKHIIQKKGMWSLRVKWVYAGVREGGLESATKRRKVYKA